MPEIKTYTQEEVEQIRKETSDAAYKAAKEKLAKKKEEQNTQAQLEELQTLKEEKAQREKQEQFNTFTNSLKDVKDTGIKSAGLSRFAKEHYETLKDKTGDDLTTAIKNIRENSNEDDKALFFEDGDVDTTKTLRTITKETHEPETDGYYESDTSSIRARKRR